MKRKQPHCDRCKEEIRDDAAKNDLVQQLHFQIMSHEGEIRRINALIEKIQSGKIRIKAGETQ